MSSDCNHGQKNAIISDCDYDYDYDDTKYAMLRT